MIEPLSVVPIMVALLPTLLKSAFQLPEWQFNISSLAKVSQIFCRNGTTHSRGTLYLRNLLIVSGWCTETPFLPAGSRKVNWQAIFHPSRLWLDLRLTDYLCFLPFLHHELTFATFLMSSLVFYLLRYDCLNCGAQLRPVARSDAYFDGLIRSVFEPLFIIQAS